MSYTVKISPKLVKILRKLSKKDKVRYDAIYNKIEEISSSEDASHYKNLRYTLSDYKGVHINSHFVLTFRILGETISFEDFQHHDKIYRR